MTKIGIIAAMDSEVQLLKENIQSLTTQVIAGTEYYTGRIGNYEVALTRCGIGKVSAALSAQIMISVFHSDCIINTGCAGALAKNISIGDIVISTSTIEWDLDLEALGLPRGFITALNEREMKASPHWSQMVKNAIPDEMTVHEGLVLSGDQFVSTPEQRHIIEKCFPTALCVEMEGAAIGHVCSQNNIPFCVVRCMSDTADGESSVNFEIFSAQAGETSGNILIQMMNA